MIKSVLLSVQSKWVEKILNGEKTIEIRKSVPKGFVGWVYIYVTRAKPYLGYEVNPYESKWVLVDDEDLLDYGFVNGKVVARFWFDDYIQYDCGFGGEYYPSRPQDFHYRAEPLLDRLCHTREQVREYGNHKDVYMWHIKRLEIFDKPMELSEFYKQFRYPNNQIIDPTICDGWGNQREAAIKDFVLSKAPQSWQYVWVESK